MRGVDTDDYDLDVSVARFRNLYDHHGVRFNIVGCQVGADGRNYTAQQIANSHAAGLVVPLTYDFLFYAGEEGSQGLARMTHALGFGLPVAPDIEGADHPGGPAAMVALMHKAKALLSAAGLFWGWYSSPPEWSRLTANTQDFTGDKGWTAAYPFSTLTQAVLPPPGYLPDFAKYPAFGGLLPVYWQYADTCYDEPGFDMNAMNPAYLEDRMIRHNAISSWYEKPEHQTFIGTRGVNVTADFALPAEAVAVQLEVYTYENSGDVGVYDGSAETQPQAHYAFGVISSRYFAGRVELEKGANGDAWCHLATLTTLPAHLFRVGCVGYYEA